MQWQIYCIIFINSSFEEKSLKICVSHLSSFIPLKIIGIKTRKAWHLKQILTATVHAFLFTDMSMLKKPTPKTL